MADLERRFGLMVVPLEEYERSASADTLAILVAGDDHTLPVLALRSRLDPATPSVLDTATTLLEGLRRGEAGVLATMPPSSHFGGRRTAVITRASSRTGT